MASARAAATAKMAVSLSIVVCICILLLSPSCCLVGAKDGDEGSNANASAQVPAQLVAKALNYVAARSGASLDTAESIVASIQIGSVDALYDVAKEMNVNGGEDRLTSIQIFHALADAHHILSMVQLGHTYSVEDKQQAIKYFVQAGEDGPHQASLYNAGRLFLEIAPVDYVRSMAYIRSAAVLADDKHTAMYAKPQMTETATKAYHDLSEALVSSMRDGGVLTLDERINMFPYASIRDYPPPNSRGDKLWSGAMEKLVNLIHQAKMGGDNAGDVDTLASVRNDLTKLQEVVGKNDLSALQRELIAAIMADTLRLMQVADEL